MIMGAMDSETDLVFEAAGNERIRIGGFEFAEGPFGSGTLIAAKSLMGMSNSAACVMAGIERFRPDAFIIQGTAGAHDPKLHRGDLVIAESFVNIGRYRSEPAPEGGGVHTECWKPFRTELYDGKAVKKTLALDSDPALLDAVSTVPYSAGRVVCGVHGSGDVWNNEIDRIKQLRETYGSDCEEMEGFAAVQICAAFGIPALGIRVISNSAFYEEETFDESTAADCQRFVLDAARRILG